jgi:hypothetical protein
MPSKKPAYVKIKYAPAIADRLMVIPVYFSAVEKAGTRDITKKFLARATIVGYTLCITTCIASETFTNSKIVRSASSFTMTTTTTTTTMHTHSSTSINDANTQSFAYMQAGFHVEAVNELAKAMRILSSYKLGGNNFNNSSMMQTSDDTMPRAAPSSDPMIQKTSDMVVESSPNTADDIPAFRIESIDVSPRDGSTHGDLACGNEEYLYDRPFALAPWRSPELTDTLLCEHYRTETRAVLLFNTALAFHRRGILVGTDDGMHIHLANAASMYNMILAMTAKAGASPNPVTAETDTAASIGVWWTQRHPSLAVLTMAVSNNLTQIYLEQLDQAPMRNSRALLRTMLQLMTRTVQAQQEEAKLQQQELSSTDEIIHVLDFTFFHLNLFCLERENFVISPAA